MPNLTISVSQADTQRAVAAFTRLANQMNPNPPVVVDAVWIQNWIKEQVNHVVVSQEGAAAREAIVKPPDIT